MKITLYEPWMKNQIIDLFVAQYGVVADDFDKLFVQFYEGEFQKDKSIRIVAVVGETVAGFQSFFYWPYEKNGVRFNSYQSGNSLVHPDYRGQGIFGKLLNFLEEIKDQMNLDFLVGFPVEASKNSFLRKGWDNILDLNWYVKFGSLKSLLLNASPKNIGESIINEEVANHTNSYKLTRSSDFVNWRKSYSQSDGYFTFNYEKGVDKVILECKLQKRKRILKEVVIGSIYSTSENRELVESALKAFIKSVKKQSLATFISIAMNENIDSYVYQAIVNQKFKLTNKKIYFIVKSYNPSIDVNNLKSWELYRSDIDTW